MSALTAGEMCLWPCWHCRSCCPLPPCGGSGAAAPGTALPGVPGAGHWVLTFYPDWKGCEASPHPYNDNLFFAVREKIGPIATPDYIQYAPSLPKTRSGEFQRWCWGELDTSCQWKLISPALLVQGCSDQGRCKLRVSRMCGSGTSHFC